MCCCTNAHTSRRKQYFRECTNESTGTKSTSLSSRHAAANKLSYDTGEYDAGGDTIDRRPPSSFSIIQSAPVANHKLRTFNNHNNEHAQSQCDMQLRSIYGDHDDELSSAVGAATTGGGEIITFDDPLASNTRNAGLLRTELAWKLDLLNKEAIQQQQQQQQHQRQQPASSALLNLLVTTANANRPSNSSSTHRPLFAKHAHATANGINNNSNVANSNHNQHVLLPDPLSHIYETISLSSNSNAHHASNALFFNPNVHKYAL